MSTGVNLKATVGYSIGMVLLAFLLFAPAQQSAPALLDGLAVKRDVAAISKFYGPNIPTKRNPLAPMRSGGSYGVGRFGWHAFFATAPDKSRQYMVFSTPLTSEDIGERVFEWKDGKLVRYIDEADGGGWTIKSHDFDVRFKLTEKKALLTDRIELVQKGRGNPLLMRFGPNYKVSSIKDSKGKSVAFSQAGGLVVLNPIQSDAVSLTLAYEGLVDKPGYAGAVTPGEAMLTNDYWYPMIARQPATYTAKIHVPKGWTAVAQGEPEPKVEGAAGDVWSYRMDLPVVYFSLIAGPYKPYSAMIDGRRFSVWSLHLTQSQMAVQAELYAPILKFYERFAKYPFSGYGAVDTPLYGGGALEAYSFATYGSGWLPDEDSHEPAHTWWGGIINNTYLKSSWNESFANFCEGLYARNVEIGNVQERREAFVSHPSVDEDQMKYALDSAGVDVGSVASDLGYGKGSFVLQMLEQKVGTENMMELMRRWIASKLAGSTGEWEDFEKIVGPDCRGFFDQWVHRPGYPRFSIDNFVWTGAAVRGTVTFQGPTYILDTDVLLEYADGRRVFKTITIEKSGSIEIPTADKPTLVSIDPWRRLLRPIAANEAVPSLTTQVGLMKVYLDPKHPEYGKFYPNAKVPTLPKDLSGVMLVGSPETMPEMQSLCHKVGFEVSGDRLTYRGTTIDLKKGIAMALVDLGEGKHCVISLGQARRRPSTGDARVVLTDDLGRFLRGHTEPKTSGDLTYRIR